MPPRIRTRNLTGHAARSSFPLKARGSSSVNRRSDLCLTDPPKQRTRPGELRKGFSNRAPRGADHSSESPSSPLRWHSAKTRLVSGSLRKTKRDRSLAKPETGYHTHSGARPRAGEGSASKSKQATSHSRRRAGASRRQAWLHDRPEAIGRYILHQTRSTGLPWLKSEMPMRRSNLGPGVASKICSSRLSVHEFASRDRHPEVHRQAHQNSFKTTSMNSWLPSRSGMSETIARP